MVIKIPIWRYESEKNRVDRSTGHHKQRTQTLVATHTRQTVRAIPEYLEICYHLHELG